MGTFLATLIIIVITLGAIAYLAERWPAARERDEKGPPVYALLPGDIKYESPSGNFKFYFPVTTSIVLSIVLSILLHFLG